MRRRLLDLLACPDCGGTLVLADVTAEDDGEVLTGSLRCAECDDAFPIVRGVPRFTGSHGGDAATAAAFGYQWRRFTGIDERYRQQFLDWISPLEPGDFEDRIVLEGGCGKGRHSILAAQFGARDVVALDLSDAVDTAFDNTRGLANVHVVQADLNHPPVRRVFDLAFSVGVLHHLPDPERGFRALVSKLVTGGRMSAWVYGREGNGWIVHLVSPVRERVTSRMPHRWLEPVAHLLTIPLFAATRALYRPLRRTAAGRALPYAAYLGYIADFPFAEQRTIVFDHLVAPIAYYVAHDEFAGWFERAGLEDVRIEAHNANSWRGTARVPAPADAA